MKYTKKVLSVLMSMMMGFTVMTTPILAESPSDQGPAGEPEVTETEKQDAEEATEAPEEETKETETPEVSEEPVKESEVAEGQEETDQPADAPEAEEKTEKTEEQETVEGEQEEEVQETVEEEQVTKVNPDPVTYDGVTVTVSYLSDAFGGKNVTLVVGKAGSKETAALNELGGEYKAVDISFVDEDGYEVQPVKGSISVSMKADGLKDSGNLDVVHVDENGKIDTISATTKTVKEFTKREKIGETTKTVKVKVPGKKNKTKTEQVKEDVYGDVKYRNVESTFSADSFSVYAVVADSLINGNQYVIYTGTTALAYSGNDVSTATVTVENGVVRSDSNNIVWTVSQQGNAQNRTWRFSNGTRNLQHQTQGQSHTVRTTSGTTNTNWAYDSYNNRLSQGNYYLTYNNGTWGLSQNVNQAATIYIARVEAEPVTGELTYNYYNADVSASISAAETVAESDYTTGWTDVATLAKAISGYQYLEARANGPDGDIITQVNGRAYRHGSETSGAGSTLNSIYFVYMKDYVAGEDVIPGLNGPETNKNVIANDDGTFTIQLDVKGVVNDVKHGANVVIVFDRTYSMSGDMSSTDNTDRIVAAVSAVNTLVNTLNPGDGPDQNDVDFALVIFDREARAFDFGSNGISGHTNWTKSGDAVKNQIDIYDDISNNSYTNLAQQGNTAGTTGGTNWQAALRETAIVLESKPDADPTYVVFMTDGEPTIYIGGSLHTNSTIEDQEYLRAVPYAKSIVNADYHMYDIFCSASTTTLLQSLYTTSGADSYVMAESKTAVEDAFREVANDMLDAIGSSDYGVNDGVPELGSFDLDTIDGKLQLSEARYYKKEADADDFAEWTDAPIATPSESGVLWDLSSVGTLQKDTIYRVEFEVWPSQAAYDMIADLNNGIKFYDYEKYLASNPDPELPKEAAVAAGLVLTDDERLQIAEPATADDEYTMKTNTTLSASYKLYGQTITDDDIDFRPDAMDLPAETISVKKLWPENMLDAYGAAAYRTDEGETAYANEIKLTLQRDKDDYLEIVVSKDGPDGDPNTKEDNWTKNDIYVSNGFMTVEEIKNDAGEVTQRIPHIKETGHDYQIIEPESFLYYWDLISDVYHPMVINGVNTLLVLDVDAKPSDVDNITYFEIEGKIYKKHSSTDNTLEASNYRRSGLNLYKTIPSEAKDAYFTYTATVKDSYATDDYVWFSAFEPEVDGNGDPVLDDKGNVKNNVVYENWVLSGATAETSTLEIAADGSKAHDIQYHEADDEHPYAYFSYYWGTGTTLFEVPAVNDDVNAPEYKTGYYYAPNGGTVTFKIKAGWEDQSEHNWNSFPGWNVRFLNLYHGSTFSFEETGMPGNYEFESVSTNTQYEIIHDVNKNWYTIEEESETGKITGTITEPNNNYYVAYTNCPKPEFYIYHSGVAGDGNLETIPMSEVNADGTYNLYAHTTPGTLYGGYYLDYEGKGDYKDDGVKVTTGVAYTGMNYQDWASCDPQTVDGTKIQPVAGETYYIKEVPAYYLRNYHQITYVKASGKLTNLYLLSAVDDLNYEKTGLILQTDDKQESTITTYVKITNSATGGSTTIRANNAFKSIGITGEGSDKEYLTYFKATNSKYFAVGEFTVLPYWITLDGITVKGFSTRTITITSMTKSGISKDDSTF